MRNQDVPGLRKHPMSSLFSVSTLRLGRHSELARVRRIEICTNCRFQSGCWVPDNILRLLKKGVQFWRRIFQMSRDPGFNTLCFVQSNRVSAFSCTIGDASILVGVRAGALEHLNYALDEPRTSITSILAIQGRCPGAA